MLIVGKDVDLEDDDKDFSVSEKKEEIPKKKGGRGRKVNVNQDETIKVDALKAPKEEHENEDPELMQLKDGKISCGICLKVFTGKRPMDYAKQHYLNVHASKGKDVSCRFPGCDRKLKNTQSLRVHLIRVHGISSANMKKETKNEDPGLMRLKDGKIRCGICFKVFAGKKPMDVAKQHYKNVHLSKGKDVSCRVPGCDRKFKNTQSMRVHLIQTHGISSAKTFSIPSTSATKSTKATKKEPSKKSIKKKESVVKEEHVKQELIED